jgi:hypothetical protein
LDALVLAARGLMTGSTAATATLRSSVRAGLIAALPLALLLAVPAAARAATDAERVLAQTPLIDGHASHAADVPHDRAFWKVLKADDFKLPAGASAAALSREVLALLGSTDPELRDGVGYEAFVSWVYRDELLHPAELESLRLTLMSSARAGLGDAEADGVFERSFAVLDLSVLAAEDLKQPFLSATEFQELLSLALDVLARERDLRGYVPGKGWAHATAHAADLLKFLARSPHLTPGDGARIVSQIAERLRTAHQVFVWGEDARLAAALLALLARPNFESAPFNAWFVRLEADNESLWKGPLDVAKYTAVRAQLNALAQLAARLTVSDPNASSGQLRQSLERLLRQTN